MDTQPTARPIRSASWMLDRYERFARLRIEAPVQFDERFGNWNVFRYADVQRVLSDHESFSSDQSAGAPANRGNPMMASLIAIDPPRHAHLRALVNKAFTPRAISELAPRIQAIANDLLDSVEGRTEIDVIDDLAYPLPVIVIAELLGIPSEDRAAFKIWSDELVGTADVVGNLTAIRDMVAYFDRVIDQRREAPRHDLVSALLVAEVDGERLSPMEILGFCVLLLVAGNETTTNLIGNAMRCFTTEAGLLDRVRSHPALLPVAIEEVLRYSSPVQMLPNRIARHDTVVGDQLIRAGESLAVWIGSANRDETKFPNADLFVADRSPNQHLAFGWGIHFCLGAPLARLEAQIALSTILRRFSVLQQSAVEPELLGGSIVFGFKHLPIVVQPGAIKESTAG